jgi:hypothetical protein
VLPAAGCHVTVLSVLVDAVFPFPAVMSWALFAPIVATTVPPVVMPFTLTSKTVGSAVGYTLAANVPPAVPLTVTSVLVKSVNGSLNTAVKRIGTLLVGSVCVAAWLIVTVGAVLSTLIVWLFTGDSTLPALSTATNFTVVVAETVNVPPEAIAVPWEASGVEPSVV